MAQNTRKWIDLVGLVEARIGADLAPKSETRLQSLANSAARMLYDESPWWERFLVLEPRTVERGYIQFTEDSYNVFGAGTSESNGLYVRNESSIDGKPAYTMYDSDGTTSLYSMYSEVSSAWLIVEGSVDDSTTTLYSTVSTSNTPPESWSVNQGESPSPIVQALSEIGEYIGHWNGAVFQCSGSTMGSAYPDHNGIRVTDCSPEGTVYVAFKKTLTDRFGDGQSGTTEDIPAEWFNFMALQSASAWTGSQKDSTVRVVDIDRSWDQALLKISRQGIYNSIALRFRTYYGSDVSVR